MSIILFELVKSMTLSEKGYFKRIAKIHAGKDNKNYLRIYKVIEKSKKFDKNTLSNHFKGTTIEKYLSSEVNYLKEKILISLFNFNMNKTKRNQIQRGILIVESLATKGFQKEALKKLKAIKKIALKQEEFTWILRLIELEEILMFKEGILGYRAKLEELDQKRSETINIIQNLNKFHILRQEIRELQFKEHLFGKDNENLKSICNNPLIASDKNCMSIKAKEHWFYIHVLISYLKWDFKAGLKISSQYVDFMHQNLHLFDHTKTLPALSNYIFHAALTNDKNHFERGKKKLLMLSGIKGISIQYIKYILYNRSLEYAYYADDKRMTEEYLALSINLINKYSKQYEESQIQNLFMVIVRASIVLKQYDKGAYYYNLWHQRGILSYRDVQAKLFSIIIYFELGYLDLVRSEIILLKKLEKKYAREKMLIRTFYKFMNSVLKYPEQRNTLILFFQKDLWSISKNQKDYFIFYSFDYYQWSTSLK